MTTIQESMNYTIKLLEQHTENIIRKLADEHGFNAEEAIQKFILQDATTIHSLPKKKSKKPRDPSKPKRGKNGFMFFSVATRPKVKAENPDMKSTDVVKELGLLWKDLPEAQKEPFLQQALLEKQAYDRAITAWKQSSDSDN